MGQQELEIKFIHCSDVNEPLEAWTPACHEEIYLPLQLDIGVVGEEAADIYDCLIATPEALLVRRDTSNFVVSDRATLIVKEFDWPKIYNALESIVRKCNASTQIEGQWKLQRFFCWEYEGFQME